MTHAITETNGKNEMAYVGETPWHGLGQCLEAGAPIERWLDAAGMSWKVQRSKVRYATAVLVGGHASDSIKEWPQHHVLFRSDTRQPLGLVSDHYKVVQPREVMEFMHGVCVHNGFKMETAGTLKGGTIYWALAAVGEEGAVVRGDAVRGYCLISTSADGTRRTEAKFTTVRVVCSNTLGMADSERGQAGVAISHRSRFVAHDVRTDLGLMHTTFGAFMEQAKALASRKLTTAEADGFVLQLLVGEDAAKLNEVARADALGAKHALAIRRLYQGAGRGASLPSSMGTAWGMLNAVTEYVDHHYPARSNDNRLVSAWFGANERLKNDAARLAVALI